MTQGAIGRLAERLLSKDPAELLDLADAFGVGAFVAQIDGDPEGTDGGHSWSINATFRALVGSIDSLDELISRTSTRDRQDLIEAIARCRRGEHNDLGQTIHLQAGSGSRVEYTIALHPIVLPDNSVRCLGIEQADEKSRLDAAAQRAATLDDIVSNVPGAVFRYTLNPDGTDRVEYMSDGCVSIWEIEAHELDEDPSPLWAMIHPDDIAGMQRSVARSAETLTEWRHEYRIVPRSGRTKWLRASGTPRPTADGGVCWHTIMQDITEQREVETALDASLRRTVAVLAATVEARDPYTAGHQQRVATIAAAIGREMGLDEHRVDGLELAASIHDVGKIQIPAEILSKPAKLSEIEFDLIRTHSAVGATIVGDIEFPWPIADMIAQHHERLDGSGYPAGLRGDEIMLEARIISVADSIEAMSSHRPYRASLGIEHAREEILRLAGTKLDADAVRAAEALIDRGEIV